MELKPRSVAKSKVRRITPKEAKMSEELLRRIEPTDNYVSTLKDVESVVATPEKILKGENLQSIVAYFDGMTSKLPEALSDMFSITEEFENGAEALIEGAEDELIKDLDGIGLHVKRLKNIERLVRETEILKLATNSHYLLSVMKALLSIQGEIKKVIYQAYEEGGIADEVVDALADLGLVEWENDTPKATENKFKSTKKDAQPSASGTKAKFKSGFSKDTDDDDYPRRSFGGSPKSKFDSMFGGFGSGRNSGFGGFGKKDTGSFGSKFGAPSKEKGFGFKKSQTGNGLGAKKNPFKR